VKSRRVEKLACEDMQQILGGPDKYAGSHEQIARAIGDAHRRNFSLLTGEDGTIALSPAYDLVSSRLVIPDETEDLALTISGRHGEFVRIIAESQLSTDLRDRLADIVNARLARLGM
jgi:hypothetical protein